MAANFTKADVSNALAASNDPKVRYFAREAEVINGVWKILDVTIGIIGDVNDDGGRVGKGAMFKFAAKKVTTVADAANLQVNSQGVKIATFMGGVFISSAEMGMEAAKNGSPAKLAAFVTLKTAEKIVSAAGLADVDKCKLALASLAVNAGGGVLTCVATGGALCMLGAASFAIEAWNTHEQCSLPPKVGG